MSKTGKRVYLDRKGSRESVGRASRPRKKQRPRNQFEMEQEVASTSKTAEKLLSGGDVDVQIRAVFGYRILDFVTVFSAISQVVKCKECGGDVRFTESSIRGLGFRLVIDCDSCDPTSVNSSPLIDNKAYDVNRRIVFAFRLLGIGITGIEKFCGIMDLPKPIFQSTYDKVVNNIHRAAEAVCQLSTRNAAAEENSLNIEKGNASGSLIVSGKGIWRKETLSSLFGISTIVGYFADSVIDLVVKYFHCKNCEDWERVRMDTEEYEEWRATHQPKCPAHAIPEVHYRSSVRVQTEVEVDSLKEMFTRSEELYKLKYTNYIGNGDGGSETFRGLVASKPYGEEISIKEKELINQVQKRMRTCLRNVRRQHKDGENKLTGKTIDELTQHYGLAIKGWSTGSLEEIKKTVWAYYHHKISQHHSGPPGTDSWCSAQKAKAEGRWNEFDQHLDDEPFPQDLREDIRAVYQTFTSDEVLELCMGGLVENKDESWDLSSMIWSIAPESQSSNNTEIIEIAAYIATSIFNDGYKNVRLMMHLMNLTIGHRAHEICEELDERHNKHRMLDC